jgi:hypothetical protein
MVQEQYPQEKASLRGATAAAPFPSLTQECPNFDLAPGGTTLDRTIQKFGAVFIRS